MDGTTNYAHSIPLSGTIIAYAERGKVLLGVIYDPFRDEIFTAWRGSLLLCLEYESLLYQGKGAYLNDKRIFCSKNTELKNAVVCTGIKTSQ